MAVLCLLAGPVWAVGLVDLDIAPQELTTALEQFSRATGMAVLVDHGLSSQRHTLGVQGRFTPSQGLNVLLSGTGLAAHYARADAFTLQPVQVREVPLPVGVAPGLSDSNYAAAIQAGIQRNLCRSALTRPGGYRALLQVWIGRDGVVQHSRLVSSTGDPVRDRALVNSLQNLRIDRPAPSSLRQPVTLLLLPDSSGRRMECTAGDGEPGR
ncbi:secretin and TonB N-terminal domain-containing protein [Pseudomonas sp. RGM2987]|uniref:secretin and TonB N-terminal domain-containing protein n=1 Tax=Pseudomonas sp. RGM2987 TaxID=2930090 RepID=UPI001FD6E769|nr:secretin and TonB N-terminal domain-containing protein [Pseudomonas sp. RGM2987]MCJ8202848.1 TonB C-terminal domain-containing protein [Pseudomonas sp. RGM2987]